jgi:uncharacterized membrane protein
MSDYRPPSAHEREETDRVSNEIYKVLLGGMYVSTACFLAGVALAMRRPQFVPLTPEWVLGQYRWSVFAAGLVHGDPASYMLAGTLALILTPILRVAGSVYVFLREGDRKYAGITGIVLAVMALTVLLSRLGLR